MSKDAPSTAEHPSPVVPGVVRRRAALVCAFPASCALPVPDSGSTVGRAWLAGAGIADTEVSGEHLRFDRRGGVLRVADAGSRNGTWVNACRLAPGELTPLDDGSVLRLGRTLLVYRSQLEGGLDPAPPTGELVGPYGLRSVARLVSTLSRSRPSNVLIEGETGVGKELVAHAVATALGRERPYGAINVAGVASGVFESQIFGHVAGAFSGAGGGAEGVAVAHDHGTLFLDEIGELAPELQAKLLRLLENREVLPVGGRRPVRVDLLVIAATNRNLEEMVDQGTFRRDLLARLSMARVPLPALRDRKEDLFALASELARRAGAGFTADRVEVEAVERLMLSPWANNVRELEAVLAAARRVDSEPGLRLWALEEVCGKTAAENRALTRQAVEAALHAAGGNATRAAERLGVSRGRLLRFRKST